MNTQSPIHLTPILTRKTQRKCPPNSSLRFSNLCGLHVWAFVILHSSFLILSAAPPPELATLRQQYDKAVTTPHETAVAALNTKFTAALGIAVTAAKQAGKLDDVIAIQDDIKRLTGSLPIPDDDEKTPESLKKLRGIYRGQLGKLEAQRTADQATILPAYSTRLRELEATLTRADRIDEAKEVKAYREALAQSGPLSPLSGVPPAPEAAQKTVQTTMPATAPAPAAGKGDDRAAAELILSIGGKIRLSGASDFVTTVAGLPKGRFTLASIELTGDAIKRPLEVADADKLANLALLESFKANRSVNLDEPLRFFATCPSLAFIHLENCVELTGAWLHYAAPLRQLQRITAIAAAKSDVTGFADFQSLGITELSLRQAAVDDDTLAALSRCKKLRALRLRNTKITDAGMAHLAGLKELFCVDVSETPVSIVGMKAMAGIPLTELGFGMTPDDLAAAATELGVLFPKVVDFQYPPRGGTNAGHLAALGKAWPKLKRLEFPSNHKLEPDAFISAGPLFPALDYLFLWRIPVTNEHVRGIAQMKKLTTLDIIGSDVTDACLPELQKMKALKYLHISGTKITPAALEVFKKARKDVSVTQ